MAKDSFIAPVDASVRCSVGKLRCAAMLGAGSLLIAAGAFGADVAAPGTSTEWGRTLERLLIVISGALSMYYGFRLFAIVSSTVGELTAVAGNWQLKLVRVGPGVFFAFFGASIMIYALSQAPSISYSAQGTVTSVRGALPDMEDTSKADRDQVTRAITTITNFVSSGQADEESRIPLSRAAQALEVIRARLVDAEFGEGAYAEWLRLSEIQSLPDGSFAKAMEKPEVRLRFNAVDEYLSNEME